MKPSPIKPFRLTLLTVIYLATVLLFAPSALAAGVVGNGTPGSCTEAAFDHALSGGGKVIFKCGPNPKTITLTNTKTIAKATSIDGGGKIVLSEKGHSHFYVNSSVTFNLQNITLKNGSGTNAGALENYGTANLTNVKFLNNNASANGGAITNHFSITILTSQFKGNSAGTAGGAIYNDGGLVYLGGVQFINNHATSTGGALDNSKGGIEGFFNSYSNNHALDGGAVYNTATGIGDNLFFSILDTFTNNQAGYGGAIENNGKLTLAGASLSKNKANADGGAIWNLTGEVDLSNSAVSQNTAGTTGGGISLYSGSMGDIEKTTFDGNHASQTGGGIYNEDQLTLYNTTLSGNMSDSQGGGIYTEIGAVTAYNNTIADNTAAAGGGFYRNSGTLDLQNTVLSKNIGGDCGGTVPSNGSNIASDNTCTGFNQTGDHQQTNAFLNPLALNGGLGLSYLPEPGSPLLDNATSLSDIDEDERNIKRPQFGSPDIGAVELCFNKPTAPTLHDPTQGATINGKFVTFQWMPENCDAFYQLTVRQGSKKGMTVIQESYVPLSYVYPGKTLAAGTYFWQIKSCDEIGCKASPWWNFKVKPGALDGVVDVQTMMAKARKMFSQK